MPAQPAQPFAQPIQLEHRPFSDPTRLAPEDAFYAHSPPKRRLASLKAADMVTDGKVRRHSDKVRERSGSRRQPGVWKKLLWVKQSYPDNYTDAPTFLSHLQRNPRLQPYDFGPLVADSTVIVQHVCAVAIFVCCFVGIIEERVSPVSVVGWGSAGTVFGWLLWDAWLGQEQRRARLLLEQHPPEVDDDGGLVSAFGSSSTLANGHNHGLGLTSLSSPASSVPTRMQSRNLSSTSLHAMSSLPASPFSPNGAAVLPMPPSALSLRNQQRLGTAKSALLICGALLGLSPILKSLTKSIASDSIWAISCWLMLINILFFDYGGGVGVKFPASLSTNAALMASTVLASRLPSTTHVFSLTLFSIEVFGLFPVFRRHLRHRSWRLHVTLTLILIIAAGWGLGLTLVGEGWKAGVAGVVVWGLGSVVAMGGCSWWLISLQKYKNVVIGPWDAARPVIRGWD